MPDGTVHEEIDIQNPQEYSARVRVVRLEHIRALYLILLPALWAITLWVLVKKGVWRALLNRPPKTNSFWVDGISRYSRSIKEGAATWRALEIIYNWDNESGSMIDQFWLHIRNAQAVRNRRVIIREYLEREILRVAQEKLHGHPVRILSLASGSAQAVIEAVAAAERAGVSVEMRLMDIDAQAFAVANEHARREGISSSLSCQRCNVLRFQNHLGDWAPDIIEMLGLIDYLPDHLCVHLFRKVKESLPIRGAFLTCHIHPNHERHFLKTVVNWGVDPHMRYRSRDRLAKLLVDGGFEAGSKMQLITEPHGIHTVAILHQIESA